MGFRFRKSIKAGPFRVNLSKSGIGYSVGTKGLRFTKKAGGGTRTTASIPGTGISYVTDSKKGTKNTKSKAAPPTSNGGQSGGSGCLGPMTVNIILLLLVVFMGWAFLKMLPQPRSIWIALAIALALPVPKLQAWITRAFQITTPWKILFAVVFFLFGGLVHNNLIHFLVIAVLVIVGVILFKRKQAVQEDTAIEPIMPQRSEESCMLDNSASIPKTDESESVDQKVSDIKDKMDLMAEAFESELNSIPRVEITISEPVQKHYLKDMPSYDFSNITRTTRLDSIFPLVFLDVETTGFAPSKEDIVEVSAIKFDYGMVPVSCFTTLCKPRKPIPAAASAVNHITDDMVAGAPEFRQIAPALTDFLSGCHLCGQNLDFDLRFIFAHGAELPVGTRFYDTLDLAQLTIKKADIDNYKLETLCSYYGVWRRNAHRSLSDCLATAKVFTHLVYDKTSRHLDEVSE